MENLKLARIMYQRARDASVLPTTPISSPDGLTTSDFGERGFLVVTAYQSNTVPLGLTDQAKVPCKWRLKIGAEGDKLG